VESALGVFASIDPDWASSWTCPKLGFPTIHFTPRSGQPHAERAQRFLARLAELASASAWSSADSRAKATPTSRR